jgi:signal transduction histidine kinase/CheY-like chemotaxis protein
VRARRHDSARLDPVAPSGGASRKITSSHLLPDRALKASASADAHADPIRCEQIDTLYRNATLGVLGAYAAAFVVIGAEVAAGDMAWPIALAWFASVNLVVGHHLLLHRLYWRARKTATPGRGWEVWFIVAAALDGVWWGCAAILLSPPERFDEQMLTLGVAFIVATGAVPAFASYLPAFLAIFIPTTVMTLVWHATRPGVLHHALAMLTGVFIVTVLGLGRGANANFTKTVRLRFEKDALAEDLRREKESAEKANLSKSRFLAAASHDLRQPIHSLVLFVGALSRHPMNDEMRRLINHIETSVHALDGLFGSLLDISRLDAGVVQPRKQPFPIAPLLERICREYTQEATEKGLSLVLRPSSAFINSDPVLVERILRNLIANAVRHTNRGRVLVGCRRAREQWRVEVWDTGPGIAPDDRERVFDEFFQVENPERDRNKGLGLGLAIVRRLASLLDHRLELYSRYTNGSVFKLTLEAANPLARTEQPMALSNASAFLRGLILVVDDEPLVLEAMRTLLVAWGAEVLVARSGAEMLARISAHARQPELIICDYRLRDGENGLDVIRRLQAEYSQDVPAVLITGDTAPDRLQQAQASGIVVLHKPVANSKLRATIGNLVNRRHAALQKTIARVDSSEA